MNAINPVSILPSPVRAEAAFLNNPLILAIANRAEVLCGDPALMTHQAVNRHVPPAPRWEFMIWCNRYARALAAHNPDHALPPSRHVNAIAYAVLETRNATRASFADYLNIADEEDPNINNFIMALKVRQDTGSNETLDEIAARFRKE